MSTFENAIQNMKSEIYNIPTTNKKPKHLTTWAEVCAYHMLREEDVLPYLNPKTKLEKVVNATVKINYISLALNEGWIPDFNDTSQRKYYPYFVFSAGGWSVFGAASWNAVAGVGSGFYYKDEKTALHAAKTFLEIYRDYLPE